jgi:hypothetical protein
VVVYGTIEGEMVVAYLDIMLTLFVWNNRVKSPNAQTREDLSLPRFEAGIIRTKVEVLYCEYKQFDTDSSLKGSIRR